MKLKLSILVVSALAMVLAGLGGQAVLASSGDVSPVYWFEDTEEAPGTEVPGATSLLMRHPSGLTAIMSTSGLIPGNAYTMWWVVFNDPAECIGGEGNCGPPDVVAALTSNENPAGIAILYAAGRVAGGNGSFDAGAKLKTGSAAGCQTSAPFAPLCAPLSNPMGAEVHLVIHDHGPPISGKVNEQLGSFDGGCESYINGPTGDVIVEYGLGDYECFSPQASPHIP